MNMSRPFFSWRWGGSSTQAWMPAYVSILRIPQMIWVWIVTVEYWQGKTEELGEKPVPMPLCPPQIPHGLTRSRTRASAVRGRRLTTWGTACQCRKLVSVSISTVTVIKVLFQLQISVTYAEIVCFEAEALPNNKTPVRTSKRTRLTITNVNLLTLFNETNIYNQS
jgi:hypothetical protein